MRSRPFPAPVADVTEIAARLLATPPLMHPESLGVWLRRLTTGDASFATQRAAQVAAFAAEREDDELMPWEEPIYEVAHGVAVVTISGHLVKGYDALTCWWYGLASLDRIAAACAELIARTDVAAVVFFFNSPGGMVQGTPETGAALARLAAAKLTITFTDTLCASAAYWLASQCRYIFATPTAQIGCIGTCLALYDWTEYLAKAGIKLELFACGTYKAMGMMGNPLSEPQRALLKAQVTRSNELFLATVRAARPEVADSAMQGQCFDGEQAQAEGLVDGVVLDFAEMIGAFRAHFAGAFPANLRQ